MKYITLIFVLLACSNDDPKPLDLSGSWTFSVSNLSADFEIFKSGSDFYVKKGSSFSIDGQKFTTGQDDLIQGVGLVFRTDISTPGIEPSYIQFPAIVASDFKSMDGSNVAYGAVDSSNNVQDKTYTEHFVVSRK